MRKIIISVCMILILFLGMTNSVKAEEEGEIIRIGNFECENFLMEKDGKSQGYAVDYLDEIAKYTGWKYEYVYDTWTNCLNMLEDGEIDMICMADYTKERSERFLYSKYPFGYEYTLMYVLPEAEIHFQDYDAMQGKNIGLMQDDANAENFCSMAEEKKLEYTPVYYETDIEILQALYEKEIDIAVVGNMQNHNELKIVERLESREIYCIFNKYDIDHCNTFNEAMEQIVMNEGNIQGKINQKYYSAEKMACGPMFTKEEITYIKTADPIPVKMLLDTRPLGYKKSGEIQGIFWQYMQLISQVSGLEFEVLESTATQMDDETRKIAEDKAITFRSQNVIESMQLSDDVNISNPVVMNSLAYVKRKEDKGENGKSDATIAITKEMSYLPALIEAMGQDYKIKYYNNAVECFEAVKNKEADILIQDLYICKYWLKKPVYEQNLAEYQGIDYENSMCLVVPKEEQILLSVINKSINYLSEEKIQNVATMEFIDHPYEKTLGDFLYQYRNWLVIIICITVIFGIICKILIGMMSSLKINKEDYEEIQIKMKKDDITNAYNKNYFYTHVREILDSSEENMCIMMMDISNFKVVNDLFGLETGDKVLAQAAEELIRLSTHEKFMVARFSEDDFFLCMPRTEFQKIEFPRRLNTGMNNMEVMLSYGVFFVEDKEIPVNIMCDRASMALHKETDHTLDSIKYYSEKERDKILQQQEIENEMQKALDEKQFSLYVQPKYHVDQNKIVGGEALVRWHHPQKGMISPAVFIEIFEKNGFIIPLDYYIWEECCRFLSKLKRQRGKVEPISINVSRAHFYGKDLQPKLKGLIQKYHLEPKDLVLEITETVCARDHDTIYSKLRELQADGFKVAMDDFGSGYSSLNMLKEMPLDIIKMDLKFLDGGEDEEKSHYILKSLILLAKQMNLEVVVEGVETGKQVDFLKKLQDVIAQGYFYSRPVEAEKYEYMLEHE